MSRRTQKSSSAMVADRKVKPEAREKKMDADMLLTWDEIPAWYQDNEFILSGYRAISNSYQNCLRSVFAIHNETVNIYSHVFGSLLFFTLPFAVYNAIHSRYQTAAIGDIVVFSTFFFGVAVCFALSATFHIFTNHSPRIHALGNRLDYLGIILLMWGSTLPSIYYGFPCDPSLQLTYYTLISVLASLCTYVTFNPAFSRPQFRSWRAAMYAGLGLSFVVPVVHGVMRFGWDVQRRRMSLDWMAGMAGCNLVGGAVYALRIPEKYFPYRFDILGASHQIMHCLVICAGIAHLCGLLRAFDHVHGQGNICTVTGRI